MHFKGVFTETTFYGVLCDTHNSNANNRMSIMHLYQMKDFLTNEMHYYNPIRGSY